MVAGRKTAGASEPGRTGALTAALRARPSPTPTADTGLRAPVRRIQTRSDGFSVHSTALPLRPTGHHSPAVLGARARALLVDGRW